MMVVPLYIGLRCTGLWSGQGVVPLARAIDEGRAESLEGRIRNETLLIDRAFQRPMFGWGSDDSFRVRNARGDDIVTVDGMWIIALGHNGLAGLSAMIMTGLLPPLMLLVKLPARQWTAQAHAPAVVLALMLILYMIDCLLNAMINPIYMLFDGGLLLYMHRLGRRPNRLTHQVSTRKMPTA